MEESSLNSHHLRTVTVRLVTDKPVKKTPYQVKGVFINQFGDDPIIPLLNGQYRKKFLYPRVQVKILNEQIYLVGLSKSVDSILSLSEKFDSLDFGNITFKVNDINVIEQTDILTPSNHPMRYRFLSPWVALNPATHKRYKVLDNSGKIKFLSQLLTHNILFLGKEMGLDIDTKIYTWLSLSSLSPDPIGEKNWGSFNGSFKTNIILPNYIGLGNGITRGFGTICALDDSDTITHDDEGFPKDSKKIKNAFFSPMKKHPTKYKKKKQKMKLKVKEKSSGYKNKKNRNNKNTKKIHPQFAEPEKESEIDKKNEGVNFNRFKYHKKQHEF